MGTTLRYWGISQFDEKFGVTLTGVLTLQAVVPAHSLTIMSPEEHVKVVPALGIGVVFNSFLLCPGDQKPGLVLEIADRQIQDLLLGRFTECP